MNTDAAARIVLTDWNDGRIPYYTEPPQRLTAAPEDAAIVSNWGADFDADQVFVFQATATPLLRCRGVIPAALQHTVLCRFSSMQFSLGSGQLHCSACANLQHDGAASCSWTRALC